MPLAQQEPSTQCQLNCESRQSDLQQQHTHTVHKPLLHKCASPEKASHTARLAPGLPSWKRGWRGSAATSAKLPGCSLPATRPIQACRPAVVPPQASCKAARAAARAAPPARVWGRMNGSLRRQVVQKSVA